MKVVDECACCYAQMELSEFSYGGGFMACGSCGAKNFVQWCPSDGPYISGAAVCPKCGSSIQSENDEGMPTCECGWVGGS